MQGKGRKIDRGTTLALKVLSCAKHIVPDAEINFSMILPTVFSICSGYSVTVG